MLLNMFDVLKYKHVKHVCLCWLASVSTCIGLSIKYSGQCSFEGLARGIILSAFFLNLVCKMIVALIVVISALIISGVAPASECQMGCSSLSIPTGQCLRAFDDAMLQFGSILGNQRNFIGNLTDCTRDTMSRLLDTLCSSQCLSSFVTHRICTRLGTTLLRQGELEVNYTLTLLCTRHADGTFCPVKVLEAANGDPLLPACARGGGCDSTCQQSYRNLSSTLGCCGSTWFDHPVFPADSGVPFFDSCNVTLDGPCEPASPTAGLASGAGALYLSMLLVVAASLLSTIMI